MILIRTIVPCLLFLVITIAANAEQSPQGVTIESQNDRLKIFVAHQHVADYVFIDEAIARPYFAHVKPDGTLQVTRTHPPVDGEDQTDHATMHPGIWLAFGDLGGSDFWRNRGRVTHDEFTDITNGMSEASFVERKVYRAESGEVVCRENFRCTIHSVNGGILLACDSTFTSEQPIAFGDQEEMGLGVRVATALTELEGGQLVDSEGRVGASEIWSQSASWCRYSGMVENKLAGVMIIGHPGNFRPSWWHVRNYGLMVANPFGRQAMKKGDLSRVVVSRADSLRLRYGIYAFVADSQSPPKFDAINQSYLRLSSETE